MRLMICKSYYDLKIDGSVIDTVTLGVPGEHNVYNSLAAAAVCAELGISLDQVKKGTETFYRHQQAV